MHILSTELKSAFIIIAFNEGLSSDCLQSSEKVRLEGIIWRVKLRFEQWFNPYLNNMKPLFPVGQEHQQEAEEVLLVNVVVCRYHKIFPNACNRSVGVDTIVVLSLVSSFNRLDAI